MGRGWRWVGGRWWSELRPRADVVLTGRREVAVVITATGIWPGRRSVRQRRRRRQRRDPPGTAPRSEAPGDARGSSGRSARARAVGGPRANEVQDTKRCAATSSDPVSATARRARSSSRSRDMGGRYRGARPLTRRGANSRRGARPGRGASPRACPGPRGRSCFGGELASPQRRRLP